MAQWNAKQGRRYIANGPANTKQAFLSTKNPKSTDSLGDNVNKRQKLNIHSDEDDLYNVTVSQQCRNLAELDFSITKDIKLCGDYNPYFSSGCQFGKNCKFDHLCEDEFLRYCACEKHHLLSQKSLDLFAESLLLFEQRRLRKAFANLQQLTKMYPLNGIINFWFARCHQMLSGESMYSAQFYFRKAISILPNNASLHKHYAVFSSTWGKALKLKTRCSQYKQAKVHFRKSLKLSNNPFVHFLFAKFLDEIENDFQDAQYHYKAALSQLTNDIRVHLNYARCLHKMKMYAHAKYQFEQIFIITNNESPNMQHAAASDRHNSLLWPHYHFGKLLNDMHFHDEARYHFDTCCKLMDTYRNKYYSEIYHEYAQLLTFHFADYTNALRYIEIAIRISPLRRYYKKLMNHIRCRINKQAPNAAAHCAKNTVQQEEKEHDQLVLLDDESNCRDAADDCKAYNDKSQKSEIAKPLSTSEIIARNPVRFNLKEEFVAKQCCATEFDRFIASGLSFGIQFDLYCDKFEDLKLNDIRLLVADERLLDAQWLRHTVGMADESIYKWRHSVAIFHHQYARHVMWLRNNDLYEKYFDTFATFGILHLQAFFYHVKSEDDVLYMIGEDQHQDAKKIWNSAKSEMDAIMRSFQKKPN